jgi:hypothetical protein
MKTVLIDWCTLPEKIAWRHNYLIQSWHGTPKHNGFTTMQYSSSCLRVELNGMIMFDFCLINYRTEFFVTHRSIWPWLLLIIVYSITITNCTVQQSKHHCVLTIMLSVSRLYRMIKCRAIGGTRYGSRKPST